MLAKGYDPNCLRHMLLVILKVKNCKKQIKKSSELTKVTKRKGDKLYVKWKGYNSFFNNWIYKKDIV